MKKHRVKLIVNNRRLMADAASCDIAELARSQAKTSVSGVGTRTDCRAYAVSHHTEMASFEPVAQNHAIQYKYSKTCKLYNQFPTITLTTGIFELPCCCSVSWPGFGHYQISIKQG